MDLVVVLVANRGKYEPFCSSLNGNFQLFYFIMVLRGFFVFKLFFISPILVPWPPNDLFLLLTIWWLTTIECESMWLNGIIISFSGKEWHTRLRYGRFGDRTTDDDDATGAPVPGQRPRVSVAAAVHQNQQKHHLIWMGQCQRAAGYSISLWPRHYQEPSDGINWIIVMRNVAKDNRFRPLRSRFWCWPSSASSWSSKVRGRIERRTNGMRKG